MKEVVVILEELLSEAVGGDDKFLLGCISFLILFFLLFLKVFPSQRDNMIALTVFALLYPWSVYSLSDE